MSPEEEEFGDILKQFHDADEDDDAEASAEAIARVWEHLATTEAEPSPWLVAMQRAHECEERFDWPGAESAYREAVVVSTGNRPTRSRAMGTLSGLFNLLGDEERALDAAVESVALARGIDFSLHLVEALGRESTLRLQRGELEVARALLEEELELIAAEPMIAEVMWPRVLIRRAQINLRNGDLEEAQADLDAAWPVLEARREWGFLTSFQAGLATWWETKASLCAAQDDRDGEAAALREAVNFRIVVSEAPQLEGPYKFNNLAHTWFKLAKALQSLDSPESESAFEQGAQIRRSIGLLPFD